MKRKIAALGMALILALSTALTGCDWGQVDRRVTVAGYTLHLSTEAAALTAQAFKNRNRLAPEDFKRLIVRLGELTEAAQRVNVELDKTATVGPSNVQGALDAVKNFVAVADGILADQLIVRLDIATLGAVRANLAAAVVVASGIQTALITLQKPTPIENLKVGKETAARAGRTAAEAGKTVSRDFTAEDAILAANVLNIGARFAAQLRLVSGADVAFVKAQRDAKYEALKKFFAEQLALT